MDTIDQVRRSENMRRIRGKHTAPELIVRRMLHALGFRYRLHVPSLPGKPDIVLPKHRKVIEVYGCFWHQHPKCPDAHYPCSRLEYWRPKLQRNKERDRANAAKLGKLGWRITRIWECETKDSQALQELLLKFLAKPD